jgi:hypothetical protein
MWATFKKPSEMWVKCLAFDRQFDDFTDKPQQPFLALKDIRDE